MSAKERQLLRGFNRKKLTRKYKEVRTKYVSQLTFYLNIKVLQINDSLFFCYKYTLKYTFCQSTTSTNHLTIFFCMRVNISSETTKTYSLKIQKYVHF